METICATVNQRLLSKANRLFTGSLQGRIIEILQNARRAGATKVDIANKDGMVTVRDNGGGIDDFAKLLDLGTSGWDEAMETSEDPAGVGVFSLAPRRVTIHSGGKTVTIEGGGWTGALVPIESDPEPVRAGTVLEFEDEPWSHSAVDINAVFCGMDVTVDGTACPNLPFLSDQAAQHPKLGCRIEVRESSSLNPWHHSAKRERWHYNNVIVNFHGQVVCFDCHPVSEHGLHFLVDMTGEPTGIRLMLPARTCLVENDALAAMKAALEVEAFRYVQRRGQHAFHYKEFLRAKQLDITLPEARPTFNVGLLSSCEPPEPIEVTMPEGVPLERCYRFDPDRENGAEADEGNIHLLAALGKLDEPLVPVSISKNHDGYSWAKPPTVTDVKVMAGKELYKYWLWSGHVTCVDSIAITVRTSDGQKFSSPVCMAISPELDEKAARFCEERVLLTPEAEHRLRSEELWYHLGGWNEDGDTYDTQFLGFEEDLERFWANITGPDEFLRRNIVRSIDGLERNWTSIVMVPNGAVTIHFKNGGAKTINPPTDHPVNS